MMKICNVIYPIGYNDQTLTKIINNPFVSSHEDIRRQDVGRLPTLWYGYKFACDLFGKENIDMMKEGRIISKDYPNEENYWCYNEDERKSHYSGEFVYECLTKFLDHIDNGIDPVFEGFDVEEFVGGLGEFPLIHNGKYELYFGEFTPSGEIIISSIKKEALKYISIDPDELFYSIIDDLEGKCMVVSTDEFDLFEIDYEPVFIVDFVQSKTGTPLTPNSLVKLFKPRYITKGEMLTYYMKLSKIYDINKFISTRHP